MANKNTAEARFCRFCAGHLTQWGRYKCTLDELQTTKVRKMEILKAIAKTILPTTFVKLIQDYRSQKSITYNQDRLRTSHNTDFMNDPKFKKAYAAGEATGSWCGMPIHWRAFVVCWAADIGSRLEGDFVECGVNKGGLASTVANYVDLMNLDKRFYLLDTYEGLYDRYLTQEERDRGMTQGLYAPCYHEVVERFRPFGGKVVIVKGAVPETLPQVATDKVAFLSIDMNCTIPEIAAAEYFWPKLVKGAIIVLDDYGWSGHYEQKKAFDVFARQRNVMVLSLPTGQGIIIKP